MSEFIGIVSIFLANAGLIAWFRSESRNDWRHIDAQMRQMDAQTNAQIRAIHEEIKDFHGRLCAIEEKNKK